MWSLVSKIEGVRDPRRPEKWREELLRHAKDLGFFCGNVYQRVVETCLSGNFREKGSEKGSEKGNSAPSDEQSEDENHGSFKHSFLFDVVYELSKCYA